MQGLAGTLVRLRAAYAQDRDQGNVNRTLKGAVYAAFAPLRGTVDDDAPQGLFARAVEFAFYRQSRANDGVAHVTAANRERCLVTLLAAHGNAFQLAVHVYVGLMEGITPEELADLVFLAGIYAGIARMTESLDTANATLEVLTRVAADESRPPGFAVVLGALRERFQPRPLTPPASGS